MQLLMRKAALLMWWLCFCSTISAQYYLRGEVKDEKNNPLQNVKIILHSTDLPYASGIGGAFGIITAKDSDSLTFSLDGYQDISLRAKTTQYLTVVMKMLPFTASLQKKHLLSFTKNFQVFSEKKFVIGDETYNPIIENDFIKTERYPETGLALNVDRASYSNIRRFLNMASQVPEDAVRIEEMLNYFNFNYTPPKNDSIFSVVSQLTSCPWNPDNELLYVQVCSKKINLESVPPSNLVFLIDVSGSMDMPNRLPLLKSAFRKLVENLRPVDTVSIVVYGGVVGVMLQPTSGNQKEKILEAIEDLNAGGFTPGEAGIRQAYRLAQSKFIKGGNNRVILATDGDFNVGQTGEQDLEELIIHMKQSGIYLTCLGVGMGNYKDSKIEVLAKKGNGNFAYLDDEREGEKVLVKELTQTLYAVADDVYMNVTFNPKLVQEYRLIGFDNKKSALSDSSSTLEGGEVGSGHSLMAVFEIVPTNRNVNSVGDQWVKEKVGTVKIHYSKPGEKLARNHYYDCPFNYSDLDSSDKYLRFTAAVCMFGGLLRDSPFLKNTSWDDVLNLAKESIDETNPLQKEFLDLVTKAKKIYGVKKKKKTPEKTGN
ncbi:MAG: hypothetical protein C5B52_12865 [Bacteroidetes bacterium]|nr:MAG: hypothetical protein C5B52_12865 [Bacteroidota bacterium]